MKNKQEVNSSLSNRFLNYFWCHYNCCYNVTCNVVILLFGGKLHNMEMARARSGHLRQHLNHKHFIIEKRRVNCTQPHRKDTVWTKALPTLVALLPFWICSVRTVVLFNFMKKSTEMFCSRGMILKDGAKVRVLYYWFEDMATNRLLW